MINEGIDLNNFHCFMNYEIGDLVEIVNVSSTFSTASHQLKGVSVETQVGIIIKDEKNFCKILVHDRMQNWSKTKIYKIQSL